MTTPADDQERTQGMKDLEGSEEVSEPAFDSWIDTMDRVLAPRPRSNVVYVTGGDMGLMGAGLAAAMGAASMFGGLGRANDLGGYSRSKAKPEPAKPKRRTKGSKLAKQHTKRGGNHAR